MGRYIVKLTDDGNEWLLEWSTVVDAPVTRGMSRADFQAYIGREYGSQGLRELPERLARVDATGTSALDVPDVDSVISCNRAGPNETRLTRKQLIEAYCTTPDHVT